MIYLDDQLEHWQATFTGESFDQVFLNYVRTGGRRQHHLYDGRAAAGPPAALDGEPR